MVRGVVEIGLEVCCTLGMLTDEQAHRLKEAGLTAYNHNLDTSPEFYGSIITTRVYDERLRTLASVRRAGLTVCCGGIIGMGESERDRLGLLRQLATQQPHRRACRSTSCSECRARHSRMRLQSTRSCSSG